MSAHKTVSNKSGFRCVAFQTNVHDALLDRTNCHRYGITKHCCTRLPAKASSNDGGARAAGGAGMSCEETNPIYAFGAEDGGEAHSQAWLPWLLLLARSRGCGEQPFCFDRQELKPPS